MKTIATVISILSISIGLIAQPPATINGATLMWIAGIIAILAIITIEKKEEEK